MATNHISSSRWTLISLSQSLSSFRPWNKHELSNSDLNELKSFSSCYSTSHCDWLQDGTIRANITIFAQWLKKKQLFFEYEHGNHIGQCGSQTPKWPPMIIASWYSHLSIIPLSQCTRICLYDRQTYVCLYVPGRSDGMPCLRLDNNRLGSLSSPLSLTICSGGS